jgi:folate-dependent phosphoribosylglycinamide formyltransferase PurN
VPVRENDTAESLAARVITEEHALYPWIVRNVIQGAIQLNDRAVRYSSEIIAEARALGYTTFE